MIGSSKNQRLPSGLMDKGVEFFVHDEKIYCLHDGQRYRYEEIPAFILELVAEDMVRHPEAIKALTAWDLVQHDEMLKQYIFCRFGGFDNEPDIDVAGNIDYTEYFDCGRRGLCSFEGKLCPTIKVPGGFLTKQEVKVLRFIGQGLMNKEIADTLNISEETVSSHNQSIQFKTGLRGKPEMAAFAVRKNLV